MGYFATYTDFNIKDVIPRELQPISISYNNYDVNIETIQDDNGSDREFQG